MSINQDCLQYAIGLTRTTCNCYDAGKPSDANRSDSGLYLLETEGLELKGVGSLADCSKGSLWEMANWARDESIISVRTDLIGLLSQLADPIAPTFSGYLAQIIFTRIVASAYNLHSLRILCRPVKGGVLRLKRIALMFGTTDTFPISLYNNLSDTPIATFTVTSEANQVKWYDLPTTLDLPLFDKGCRNLIYSLVYENTGQEAMDNQVNCGCGGASHYNEHDPKFNTTKDNWSNWVNISGSKGNDFLERQVWSYNLEANGLAIDADIFCNVETVICDGKINYQADPLAYILAYAIRFRAAQFLISRMINSSDPNRFTMASREQMAMNYETYGQEANSRIASIASELATGKYINKNSDCFTCKPAFGYQRTGLLV